MNTKTAYIAAAAAIACAGMTAAAVAGGKSGQAGGKGRDYASLVNPFIGTGGHGHTFPGAVVPPTPASTDGTHVRATTSPTRSSTAFPTPT